MADESGILKILIQLGVLGEDEVKAAKQLLDETGATGKDALKGMTESMPDNLKAWNEYSKSLKAGGTEADGMHEKFRGLQKLLKGMGPEAQELGHLLHFAFNPVFLVGAAATAGLQAVFSHLEQLQQKQHELIADGQKVNNVLREITAARPSEGAQWEKFVEQMAKLSALAPSLDKVFKHFNETEQGLDANKIANAFDFEKPGLQRKAITNDIDRAASDRDQAAKHSDVAAAQKKANDAASELADVKMQMAKLPQAIAYAETSAAKFRDQANKEIMPGEKWHDLVTAMNLERQAGVLKNNLAEAQKNFPGAADASAQADAQLQSTIANRDAVQRLTDEIVSLNNKLGVFDNAQQGAQRKGAIEQVMRNDLGGGQTLEKMGAELHLTQQQMVTMATRILDGQLPLRSAIAGLNQRLSQMEQQGMHSHRINNR